LSPSNEQAGKNGLSVTVGHSIPGSVAVHGVRRGRSGIRNPAPIGNSATWMTTFADLCTLLLTFFVLLFSMSSLNENAFRYTFQIHKSVGKTYFEKEKAINPRELVIEDLRKNLGMLHGIDIRDLDKIATDSRPGDGELSLLVSGRAVWIHRIGENQDFSIIFGQELLFGSGDASLSPAACKLLDLLGGLILKGHYHCYIDGHTDDTPVHNARFASNDELSVARAEAVLDYLIGTCEIDPAVLAIGGYGATHPLVDNKDGIERQANRRVEIIFRKKA
jgi:chemotaxis protein MotB